MSAETDRSVMDHARMEVMEGVRELQKKRAPVRA